MLLEKNAIFWKTVFSDETMLELNSKEKDLVRRPRKTRLDTRFSRKTIFSSKKIDGVGIHSIEWRWIADTRKKQGGFR